MKKKRRLNEKPEFIKEMEAQQRNVWFADTLRNGTTVNRFMWYGSPTATLVQRVGLTLYGLCFLIIVYAIAFMVGDSIEYELDIPRYVLLLLICILSFPFAYLGYRFFRNALRRK